MTQKAVALQIRDALEQAGVESASFETMQLVCATLGISEATLIAEGEAPISQNDWNRLDRMLQKRLQGYPLQYLLGEWGFYGRDFFVGEGVLIPRADTEILCAAVISKIRNRAATVIDLCSGSGCIAVTIALECPNTTVYAVEKSEAAFSYLQQNIARHHAPVKAFLADALDPAIVADLPECDLIISNPPYLTATDLQGLQTEVSFEPTMALDGGTDGLDFYRCLTARWKTRLKTGGQFFYEIGMGQGGPVAEIFAQNGFCNISEETDLSGVIRVIHATKL